MRPSSAVFIGVAEVPGFVTTLLASRMMIDRAIGITGIAISIISVVARIVFPDIDKRIGWAGMVVGILLLGAAGGIALLPDGKAQAPAQQPGVVSQGPGSAFNSGPGTIVGPFNNFAPSTRTLKDPRAVKFKERLLKIPRIKLIAVSGLMGDRESMNLAQEVQLFMQGNGYKMKMDEAGQSIVSPPQIGWRIDEDGLNGVQILIGKIPTQ